MWTTTWASIRGRYTPRLLLFQPPRVLMRIPQLLGCIVLAVLVISSINFSPRSYPPSPLPRIIHHSWKTRKIPLLFREWASSWTRVNPTYTRILWTDEMNRKLVKDHYPFALETYDGLPENIQRADMARYFYLHRYGGVYADLDVEALRPMDELFWKHIPSDLKGDRPVALLGLMSRDYEFVQNIPNAWMASTPGHSLWMHVVHYIIDRYSRNMNNTEVLKIPEEMTGPIALKMAFDKYRQDISDSDPVIQLEPGVIYPMDWHHFESGQDIKNVDCWARSKAFNEKLCRKQLVKRRKAFTVTYWSHSWDGPWDDKVGYPEESEENTVTAHI
ncbi:nucleotide-diphospho-sugar transferase [Phlyctochytrium arcticum]|nr:nucleotide-diphospho-sugar transferase [Phlyctochytrium arcticum]